MSLEDRLKRQEATRKNLQKKFKDKYGVAHFERYKLSSGVFAMDQALDGGPNMGTIIEVYGKPSSGKTTTALR